MSSRPFDSEMAALFASEKNPKLLRLGFKELRPLQQPGMAAPVAVRWSHKFATPPSPNLEKLRQILTVRLVPVHFFLRNNITFQTHVWDQHFIGIMCSPKFEGKTHKEINRMVEELCEEVGMGGRVRILCQPPSRWHMMKHRTRRRWDFDR
eukprot:symbB.v1.2.006074.t1/scaffold332.1/size322744/9